MELLNDLYVLSLTHWDREWRFPFEKTRMLLVEMMDELLRVLDENPDYACFHLDGQTVLLEDYCEVRPENEQRIRRYVEQGRIRIGPWYVLPEENQVSGESLVRNFLLGERVGRRFGPCMKVGYTPTSWGQVSQMPQIMRGFGIDSIIFYRGITPDQVEGNYYRWEGPDGSRLLGVRLGDHARVSFFHLVHRRVVMGRGPEVTGHQWEWGGKPFRVCGSGTATPYRFAAPPIEWHPERIEEAFVDIDRNELGDWKTSFAPVFDCDDSTAPFAGTPRIIEAANERVENDRQIVHTDLERFIADAREELDLDDLEVMRGEMRYPERAGLFTDLYGDVQATRLPMKRMNRRAEVALQRRAEPLATIAWCLGEEYPRFDLDEANRKLIQNHAHDSIGGCGRDEVNEAVENRFREVRTTATALTENACRRIAGRIDTGRFGPEEMLLIVFNPLPRERTEVVEAEIDISADRQIDGLRVEDPDGNEMPVQILDRFDFQAPFDHPHELPLRIEGERWKFLFHGPDVPAMGYRVFRIVPFRHPMRHPGSMLTGSHTMENEHLAVTVNPNGTVDVVEKSTGRALRKQNLFRDRGETGDYWVGDRPLKERVITSHGAEAQVSLVEDGRLRCTMEARLQLDLPVGATEDGSERREECRTVPITIRYSLVAGEPFLRIRTTIDNRVEDHLLSALFPTGVRTDVSHAEVPIDVVERDIPLPQCRDWREPHRPRHPQRSFVDLSDGQAGVALLNRGLPQYETFDDEQRTVGLTLLRAHRAWNSVRLAHYPDQHGTQLPGEHTFDYALMPHRGDWQVGGVLRAAERFNVEPVVGAAGPGEGELPVEHSFIELEGDGLVLDAVKQGEWDESVILRISNPGTHEVEGLLRVGFPVKNAARVNLMETEMQGELPPGEEEGGFPLEVPAKKVLTVKLQPGT